MTIRTELSSRRRFSGILGCTVLAALPVVGAAVTPDSRHSTKQTTEPAATQQLDHHASRAAPWGLDHSEWQRYQSLLQGIRGSVSPATLSPIEVLGIHARSVEERQRYAEQWAEMMRDDAERILAFQRAYDEAQRRLFPDQRLIDTRALASSVSKPVRAEELAWQSTDRVLFFTDTQCPTCDAVLERLVRQLEHFGGIDLYLIDVAAGEESRIREWAASKQIDPALVSEHKITLNIDAGALDRISAHTGQQGSKLPVLVRRRGDQLMPLPTSLL